MRKKWKARKRMNNSNPLPRPVLRGDIYFADLPEDEIGSIQAGRRPVLITQANYLNKNSTTVIVAVITSKLKRTTDPVHVVLPMIKGLPKQSMVVAEQRKTISKSQLLEYRGSLDAETMKEVTRALRIAERPDRKENYSRRRKINHSRKANMRNGKSHKCNQKNKKVPFSSTRKEGSYDE